MSGNPAFQATPVAFQSTAFQSGVQVVASDYSIGSPIFATPAWQIKFQLSAAAYSIGSPAFATPTLTVLSLVLHANPYWITPTFATPTLRAVHSIHVNAYSLGSPAFAAPTMAQRHRFFTNAMAIGSPDFATPRATTTYQLSGLGFAIGSPIFATPGPIAPNYVFIVEPYWITPKFGYPRLQWRLVETGIPPTYLTQVEAAADMLAGLLNLLLKSIPSTAGAKANDARRLIGALRANAEAAIRGNALGTDLAAIYNALWTAGATFGGIEAARQYLMQQAADQSVFTQIVFRSALVMTLALESRIITAIRFTTQADVQTMLLHVSDMFDAAKAIGIDEVDAATYQTVNALGGAITNHLARTELQLPRFITYTSDIRMPSLYLANRIYADASRYQEIERENSVIHPMFVPQTIRVLSNAGR